MFDIAPTELMLVAVVALVVVGPKDLPRVLRFVGMWVGRARGMARQFRSGIDEMIRQAELDDMQKKWADENARIMREHPAADVAATHPDVADHPAGAEPSAAYAMTPLPAAEPGAPADSGPAEAATDRRLP